MGSREVALFDANLKKANEVLKYIGLQTDDEESNQSFMERVRSKWLFLFCNLNLYFELLGELAWFVERGIMGNSFIEATYTLPCATLCLLGTAKTYYRLKYGDHINDLIHSLRKLQSMEPESGIYTDPIAYEAIRKMVSKLSLAIKALTIFNASGLIAFYLGPIAIMSYIYQTTGIVKLRFPFLILYPFNAFDLRFYFLIYLHQMIGGAFAVYTVFGPDCLYYLFCTFVQVQFCSLKYDLERIVPSRSCLRQKADKDAYRKKFGACITRHKELIRFDIGLRAHTQTAYSHCTAKMFESSCMYVFTARKFCNVVNLQFGLGALTFVRQCRCVRLIETVYCKPALYNFLTSSLLLCLAGFNIVAYEDLAMLGNFLSFLVMCVLQIYLICYYGDNVSRASVEISDAVYNSEWYNLDPKTAKDLRMVLIRSQTPCKLTADTYTDINLSTFTRILSTAWSYFALLQSVYTRK